MVSRAFLRNLISVFDLRGFIFAVLVCFKIFFVQMLKIGTNFWLLLSLNSLQSRFVTIHGLAFTSLINFKNRNKISLLLIELQSEAH